MSKVPTAWTAVFRGGNEGDPQIEVAADVNETKDAKISIEDNSKTKIQSKFDDIRRRFSSIRMTSNDAQRDNDEERDTSQQYSPPNRKRWSLLGVFSDDLKRIGKEDPSNEQQPSPPGHKRRWTLLTKLTEDIKLNNHRVNDGNEEDSDSGEEYKEEPNDIDLGDAMSSVSSCGIDRRSVSDIQGDAQRVCSVLSGDAKRHMKILKSIDPTNLVLVDVKKAITEANVWLTQCIAPSSSGEAECIKEAKITQQYHAERCLLDASTMAVNEIKRLSEIATSNTIEKDISMLLRTKSI